jgi:hypothetical protein
MDLRRCESLEGPHRTTHPLSLNPLQHELLEIRHPISMCSTVRRSGALRRARTAPPVVPARERRRSAREYPGRRRVGIRSPRGRRQFTPLRRTLFRSFHHRRLLRCEACDGRVWCEAYGTAFGCV